MLLAKLSLGTAQFGSKYGISSRSRLAAQEIGPILELAKRFGITTLDTAPAYGEAEKLLGKHDLSSFKVVTKTLPKQLRGETVLLGFLASLENLNLPKVDTLLIHQTSDPNVGEQIELLYSLKQRGYAEKIGVSVYSPYELRSILRRFTPDVVSLPVSIFDQRFSSDTELIDMLVAKKVEIHARSVFLQGAVFMDHLKLPKHLEKLSERLAQLTPRMALEFVKRQVYIDRVTIGVDSLAQFIDLCHLWENDLTGESIDFSFFKEDDPSVVNPSLWPVH